MRMLHRLFWLLMSTLGVTLEELAARDFNYGFSFVDTDLIGYKRSISFSVNVIEHKDYSNYHIYIYNNDPMYFTLAVNSVICTLSACDTLAMGLYQNVTIWLIRPPGQIASLVQFVYPKDELNVFTFGCNISDLEKGKCVHYNSTGIYQEQSLCACHSAGVISLDCAKNTDSTCNDVEWWNTTTLPPAVTTQSTPFTIPESSTASMSTNAPTTPSTTTLGTTTPSTTTLGTTTPIITTASKMGFSSTTEPDSPTTTPFPPLPDLSNTTVTIQNVSSVLNDTMYYSDKKSNLNGTEIAEIVNVLQKCANVSGLNSTHSVSILQNVDNVLYSSPDEMEKSGNSPYRNSIIVPTTSLCSTQEVSHVMFTIYRSKNLFINPRRKYRNYAVIADEEISTTQVPVEEAASACSRQTSLPDDLPVMSATVMSNSEYLRSTSESALMARLRFNVSKHLQPLHGSFKVSWWDTSTFEWSLNQPCTIISHKNGMIDAECIHLTDFTVIIDGAINDPIVCETALITLGYIANSFSILSLLFLAIVSMLPFIYSIRNSKFSYYMRGELIPKPDSLMLAYYTQLLFFYVLFTFFSNQDVAGPACEWIATFMYFFFISSLFLTIFQGLRTISTFVPRPFSNFLLILTQAPSALCFCGVIPLFIAIILKVFTSFYERNDCFCWVRPDYILYAIILPITILIINAVLCGLFMAYKIFYLSQSKLRRQGNNYHDNLLQTKIIALFIMMISLGLPWIIQYFTISNPSAGFWHYLFTIVMGSQGTILFSIFVYKRHKNLQFSQKQRSFNRSKLDSEAVTREEQIISVQKRTSRGS